MRELSKIVIIITLFAIGCFACKNNEVDYCRYVDPFIGTSDNGHTFPGACLPFGLVQFSPETGNDSWRYCSGFHFEDDSINWIRPNSSEWYRMFRFRRCAYFTF